MISTSKKFIFVHIPKTAGNSVQDALRAYADDDIVTLNPVHDGTERFEVRNAAHPHLIKHSTMSDYARALGHRLDQYYVFATIRNPYDKLVSYYFSPHRGQVTWDKAAFKDFVRKIPPVEHYLCRAGATPRRTDIGLAGIDALLRFEHLTEDFADLCRHLDITDAALNHRNQSFSRRPYRDCYDAALRDWVAETHALEIALGGYSF